MGKFHIYSNLFAEEYERLMRLYELTLEFAKLSQDEQDRIRECMGLTMKMLELMGAQKTPDPFAHEARTQNY